MPFPCHVLGKDQADHCRSTAVQEGPPVRRLLAFLMAVDISPGQQGGGLLTVAGAAADPAFASHWALMKGAGHKMKPLVHIPLPPLWCVCPACPPSYVILHT